MLKMYGFLLDLLTICNGRSLIPSGSVSLALKEPGNFHGPGSGN